MDAVEDVGEIGLRIEAIHLGFFSDRSGAYECFRSGFRPGKQSVFASDADRTQSTFGWIIVYGHTIVCRFSAHRSASIDRSCYLSV